MLMLFCSKPVVLKIQIQWGDHVLCLMFSLSTRGDEIKLLLNKDFTEHSKLLADLGLI